MYSFFCEDCNDSFSSEDKSEVSQYSKYHKRFNATSMSKVCPLRPTKRGTFARPFLVPIIDAEVDVNQLNN